MHDAPEFTFLFYTCNEGILFLFYLLTQTTENTLNTCTPYTSTLFFTGCALQHTNAQMMFA